MNTDAEVQTRAMPTRDYHYVRSHLLECREIALIDVREEAPHAQGHPLSAANFPLSRIELDAYTKLPRYEGTNASREAMQGYLDWEFGLIAQLRRDGTHHFQPLVPGRPHGRAGTSGAGTG